MSVNAPTLSADLFGFAAENLDAEVIQYVSGAQSSPAIINGVIAGQAPLCVTACNLSERAFAQLEAYVQRPGSRLLVDSGAFLYRDNPKAMPWARVIEMYRRLSSWCDDQARIDFVLPDVVGDQDGTLAVLNEWGRACVEAVGDSDRCLLTIQGGSLAPDAFIDRARAFLGFPIRSIALPCKVAQMPAQQLHCLERLDIRRIHLLGTGRCSRITREYGVVLGEALPGVRITCDSTSFRAQIGKGREITETRREYQRREVVENGEIYADLAGDSELRAAVIALLHEKGDPTTATAIAALDDDELEDEQEVGGMELMQWGDEDLLLECYLGATGLELPDDPSSTRAAIADWALAQSFDEHGNCITEAL